MTSGKQVRRILWIGLASMFVLALLGPPIAAELICRVQIRRLGAPSRPAMMDLPPIALAAFWIEAGERLPMESKPIWKWHCPLTFVTAERLSQMVAGERMAARAARIWLGEQAAPPSGMRWQLAWGAATVWTSRNLSAEEMTRSWVSGAWFGRGARGLEAAADVYFGKKVEALRLHELALLVGLTQVPRRFDPDCSPEEARARRRYILHRLLDAEVISKTEHGDADAQPLGSVPRECRRE